MTWIEVGVRRVDAEGNESGPTDTVVGGSPFRDVEEAQAWVRAEALETGPGWHLWVVRAREVGEWRTV